MQDINSRAVSYHRRSSCGVADLAGKEGARHGDVVMDARRLVEDVASLTTKKLTLEMIEREERSREGAARSEHLIRITKNI